MIILSDKDRVDVNMQGIEFDIGGKKINYMLHDVFRLSMLTTDKGPVEDDVALGFFMNDELYIIQSQHPLFEHVLFDEVGIIFPVDIDAIEQAADCTENKEFLLYSGK